nr:hypothetical transcript [Hymenolepis microstoma]
MDLPPRGTPWATYTHMAKKSINRQLTSNYHDPTVCHIPPLPQHSPHLIFFYIYESLFSSVPLSTLCDFDCSSPL